MFHLHHKILGTVAAATFASTFALAMPVIAADATPNAAPHTMSAHAKARHMDPVEMQIARLHEQLQITDAQTAQFNAVTQVMRDNRNAHDALVKEKRQNEKNLTAVEDLQAYAQIAQSHADGVKKLAEAFDTLYASLSDSQKKAADEAFRQHKRRAMQHDMHPQMHHDMPHQPQ